MIPKRILIIIIFCILVFAIIFNMLPYLDGEIKNNNNNNNYNNNNNNNNNNNYYNTNTNTNTNTNANTNTNSNTITNNNNENVNNNNVFGEEINTFKYDMVTFPWDEYRAAARSQNSSATDKYSQMLIGRLSTYIVMEPPTPINQECKPDPLPEIDDSKCSKYNSLFSGKRSQPTKIAHMVQLGFDVDVLEVHLNELYEVVDHFFIIESTTAHYHKLKKPLIWEHVKFQDRFIQFQDKVVHLILDDSDEEKEGNMFSAEAYQENRRWQKFLEWNKLTKYYSDEDIVGFGDTDEVSARINVHLLKHCQLRDNIGAVDIGIWFPYGPVDQVFRTDWPVPGNPYTLGDPTYYTIKNAKNTNSPTRSRGRSGNFMLGGIHMTHYGYLPFQILKRLSCSECGITDEGKLNDFASKLQQGKIQELESQLLETVPDHRNRITPLSSMDEHFKKEVAILPWFLKCNPDRYPTWYRKNDKRLF